MCRAPLVVLALLALGCRPTRETQPAPNPDAVTDVDDGGEQEQQEPSADADRAPRPAGVIYRSELVRGTRGGSAAYLMSQVGPEPYRPQGRFEGWVITRVWPGDPELCAPGCDLRAGDIIMSVNGSKMETPEDLSNLLARLEELESIELTGMRDGEFFERSHPILPDPGLL